MLGKNNGRRNYKDIVKNFFYFVFIENILKIDELQVDYFLSNKNFIKKELISIKIRRVYFLLSLNYDFWIKYILGKVRNQIQK